MAASVADRRFASSVRQGGLDALEWVLRFAQDRDPESPEYGGVRNLYDAMRGEFVRRGHGLCLTWSACLGAFASLAAHGLTGDPFYRQRVDLIAHYVKGNQNLDQSDPIRWGSFLVSRDRAFVDVPDLSWAGNLFVDLYRLTEEEDYLARAKLAADWLLRVAPMSHGGFTSFYLLESRQPVAYSHASDGEHGFFLANLHDVTGDDRYGGPLERLADVLSGPAQHESGAYYASIRADGTPVFEGWDEESGHPFIEGIEKAVTGPRQNYYAARFLIEQYRRDPKPRYLESVRRCAEWSVDVFRRYGYLSEWLTLEGGEWAPDGHPDVAAPGAMIRVWLPLNEVEPDARWLDVCHEAAEWTLRWQRRASGHPDIEGAILTEPFVIAYHNSFAAWGLLDLARHLLQS